MDNVSRKSLEGITLTSFIWLFVVALCAWLLSLMIDETPQWLAITIALIVFIDKLILVRVTRWISKFFLASEMEYPGKYEERRIAYDKDLNRIRKAATSTVALLLSMSVIAEVIVTGGV